MHSKSNHCSGFLGPQCAQESPDLFINLEESCALFTLHFGFIMSAGSQNSAGLISTSTDCEATKDLEKYGL